MSKLQSLLITSKNVSRSSYIWNTVSNMLYAFQSVILLTILTRTVGLVSAGVFTIAYANANLFLTIGKFGMRNFHVSDVNRQYTFGEYRLSRIISTIAMIVVSFGYTIFMSQGNDYSLNKSLILLVMCVFKIPDSYTDVYYGEYQREKRLDIAAKIMTVRIFVTMVVFAVSVIVSKDLLVALVLATIVNCILMYVLTKLTISGFTLDFNIRKESVKSLLWNCMPLFVGTFLSFYIGNAPKYAIDSQLSDSLQACYGFISMPVFVIGLLNGFIFSPIIYKLSWIWSERKTGEFIKRVCLQVAIVGGITVVCIVGAYILGIPVLSILYNTDLSPYKVELIVLLLGGGFLCLSGLLNTVITIIRCQKAIFVAYALVGAAALLLSDSIVASYGMMGAAWLYTGLMAILSFLFVVILVVGVVKKK